MVLQSGHGVSHAYPIYKGYAVGDAILRADFGGAEVTEVFRDAIPQLQHQSSTPSLMRKLSAAKEKYAFCAPSINGALPAPIEDTIPLIESYSGIPVPHPPLSYLIPSHDLQI